MTLDVSSKLTEEDIDDMDADESEALKGYCVSDMWLQGITALEKMNVKATRQKQRDRLKRKKKVQKVVLQHVENLKAEAKNIVIDVEISF